MRKFILKKPKILLKDSYLSMIKNSEGTKMFRDCYGKIKGKKENLTKSGRLSCAFFVSSILYHFNLIKTPHLTVDGTLKDMRKSGWFEIRTSRSAREPCFPRSARKIKKLKAGSIILWETATHPPHPPAKGEPLKQGHQHLGFYLGRKKAISNDKRKRAPKIHHFTFNGKRKIKTIFWNKKLDKI